MRTRTAMSAPDYVACSVLVRLIIFGYLQLYSLSDGFRVEPRAKTY
jgi:hypothetical protein